MCGRFSDANEDPYAGRGIRYKKLDCAFTPRFNVCPSQNARVIFYETSTEPTMKFMKWGLVPPWAKDQSIGYKMINARAETISEKPSYRKPFANQRCLVVADGFYEWKRDGKLKLPHYFSPRSGEAFAFAGIWERSVASDGQPLCTFSLITTQPNELTRSVHDRMPVMLSPNQFEEWLDPGARDVAKLQRFLVPFPADSMQVHRVSTRVNSPKVDDPECVQPIAG